MLQRDDPRSSWSRGPNRDERRVEPRFDDEDEDDDYSDIRLERVSRRDYGHHDGRNSGRDQGREYGRARARSVADEDDLDDDDYPVRARRERHNARDEDRYHDRYESAPRPIRRTWWGGRVKEPPPAPPPQRARARRTRGFFARLIYWPVMVLFWGAVLAIGAFAFVAYNLPQLNSLQVPQRPPNVQILDYSGQMIANRGDTGGEQVHLADLPAYVSQAVIATEDRHFYYHFGVDPTGLLRAVITNATSGGVVQGGSTLTQQLAKNLFLQPDRTLARKLEEVGLAFRLEMTYSKTQILEMYLNRVYMGAGAYGADAASRRYFGKSAKDINLLEAAILAGLLKAPTRYAPTHDPKLSVDRASTVLKGMVEAGYISEDQRQAALKTPLWVAKAAAGGSANYVADWVMDLLPGYVSSIPGDLIVQTTIDLRLQRQADAALYETLQKDGAARQVSQGAIVSMDTAGAIRALVGGKSYPESQFNRAIFAKRQPGSSFKPFVYLTAMERGLTPDTIRNDEPLTIKGWTPKNFEKKYEGAVTLTQALADSINTVAIRLASEVGVKNVIQTARRLGISSELQPNLSIALGTSEVTPLEMTAAYVPFANGGTGVIPFVIQKITAKDGGVLFQQSSSGVGQVVNPAVVGEMNYMLSQTLISGTGKGAGLGAMPAAGKTGTSEEFRDAWFIGYTSRLVTGVWLGNDDNAPTKRTTGGSLPAQIWHRVMAYAVQGVRPEALPGLQLLPGVAMAVPQASAVVSDDTQRAAEIMGKAPPNVVPVQSQQKWAPPTQTLPQTLPQAPLETEPLAATVAPTARTAPVLPATGSTLGTATATGRFIPPDDANDVPDGLPNAGPVDAPDGEVPQLKKARSIEDLLAR